MMGSMWTTAAIWIGIGLCVAQSGTLAGLNLAVFSLSRLRLEIEVASGHPDAAKVHHLRTDSNLTLATIVWANVGTNVVLTLLSESVLAGLGAFVFSTFVITIFGELLPQAYFSRHALYVAARLTPFIQFYRVLMFPFAKPTALVLDWWLGAEGIALLRERDFRALITRHFETSGADVGRLEGTGALNFLDIDDVAVAEEGEPVDPLSVISLPVADGRPVLPAFSRSPTDPFLRRIEASGRKWVIIVDPADEPCLVMNADHFLRDALFDELSISPEAYWHRPIVVRDLQTRLGEVIGRMKVKPERPGDDVIDNDLILVWSEQRRIITGADLLGRLLRGIAAVEPTAR
jgi:hypothetical protein